MKVVVLAGGQGTRLAEETEVRPKPMVEIGGRPLLWHIMKHYAHHGFREFVLALGHRGEVIKRYLIDYRPLHSNLTVDVGSGAVAVTPCQAVDDWKVHLVDTGYSTLTGGRVQRLKDRLAGGTFMVTYGDGLASVDVGALLRFHRHQGKIATLTAVRPPARFGSLVFDGERVVRFSEKPQSGEGWINGGFLVFEPAVFSYLEGDDTSLEAGTMERLAADGQLAAYRHEGFWQCVDTLRDLRLLRALWDSGDAPWKTWE